jgi:hypothetical protein
MPPVSKRNDGGSLDATLTGAIIAVISATALVFFAAYRTPLHRVATLRPRLSRSAINAAEEQRIWSRSASDDR